MGKLVIKIICGRNLKGSDMFSDADGYVKLTIGSKTFRTKAINNDANPNWNESFSFFVTEAGCDNLKLELWDANTFKDDLIANASVPLNDLVKDTRILKRINLSEGKGEIHLELLADFGAANPNPQQQQQQQFQQPMMTSAATPPNGYGVPPVQHQSAAPPPQAYGNPYGGAGAGGYVNPYAQQQPQVQQQAPQPQAYSYPGQNPYAGQQYTGQPQQQQQQAPSPQQPQVQPGGYPSAANYSSGYSNPYAHSVGHPQQGGAGATPPQQQGYANPYASQYPGAGGGGRGGGAVGGYPGAGGAGGSQVGGLGFMPGSVGGVNYY